MSEKTPDLINLLNYATKGHALETYLGESLVQICPRCRLPYFYRTDDGQDENEQVYQCTNCQITNIRRDDY